MQHKPFSIIGIQPATIALLLAATIALSLHALAQTIPPNVANAKGEVTLVVDFEVKPGSEPEFNRAFELSVKCSRLEAGNIAFNIHRVVGAERQYVLYEIWRSPNALQSHFERPYTKALFAAFERTLVRPVSEGGLRYIIDQSPQARPSPVSGDPSRLPECR